MISNDSDDSQGDGESPLKKKVVDLAALSEQLRAQGYDGDEREQTGKAAKLVDDAKRYSVTHDQIAKTLEPYRSLQGRMKNLGLSAGEDSAIGRLAKQIADQHRAIEAMRPSLSVNIPSLEPPRLPIFEQINLPPNPIFETNRRLERIEERFEQMQGIATDAAQIANGLQGAAAEFLQKFERAAADNDRTAGRAIWLGVVAVIIAIAMPAAQIGYTEFRRMPDNGPEMKSALADLQAEIAGLRDAQAEASAQLGEVINSSDDEIATILREIRDLLSKLPAPVGAVLEEAP